MNNTTFPATHIKKAGDITWCGILERSWGFYGVDHVLIASNKKNRYDVCDECVEKVIKLLKSK